MKELVFSVGDIFNKDSPSGCLHQYESEAYYIPTYQRGYKWSSDKNGPVSILLNDLWQSFHKKEDEYFLQYITLKAVDKEGKSYLEVIDGQQRLTTLSILLQAFACSFEKINVADQKLKYAVRNNFFKEHIYPADQFNQLVALKWKSLVETDAKQLDKQDIFYLHAAACRCAKDVRDTKDLQLRKEWYQYILKNVKIIVNSVENHIQSETVFRNLNSNKVPLTEPELTKGLFITRLGRQSQSDSSLPFREISELRTNFGRQWDELAHWANQPEIRSFYFQNAADGMQQLLKLAAHCLDYTPSKRKSTDFPLFNYFAEKGNYIQHYHHILSIKLKLENWYKDAELYNLIGFLRYCKNGPLNTPKSFEELLKTETKTALIDQLNTERKQLFDEVDLNSIVYGKDDDTLHHILLALNVFAEGKSHIEFDFYRFQSQKWTLEHIFPQTPEGQKKILRSTDKAAILDFIGHKATDEIKEVLAKDERNEAEKDLYRTALIESDQLNKLGNICLLSNSDNIANSNKFFDQKRENILKLIKRGSFIPAHTIEVFSKMFPGANTGDMTVWTATDIDQHTGYIQDRLSQLSFVPHKKPAIV